MAELTLNKEQHIKYWRRCLTSFLPTQYTSTDSTRMTLGFFILSALDLLGAGADTLPEEQRTNIRNWILHCQHPSGGFCGSANHKYPDEFYKDIGSGRKTVDPANLPATFFALLSLSFVGGLGSVDRRRCLQWLRSLQREDGSFGELITQDGRIEGGKDMRYCYVAAAVRWVLRGEGKEEANLDIDVERLVDFLRAGQTYDGGISESSEHEAHAGYTYCAIAALSLLGRLPTQGSHTVSGLQPGLTNIPDTIHWLVSRQMSYREEDDSDDETNQNKSDQTFDTDMQNDSQFVGFNGRCNKNVDTCYAFWVGASLDILGCDTAQLINAPLVRGFLFEQTQHRIGGFGKYPGNPPDIYHSYLGLAALAVMKEPDLKPLDSALCISANQRQKISQIRESASRKTSTYWKHDYSFPLHEDNVDFTAKLASYSEPPKDFKIIADILSQKE